MLLKHGMTLVIRDERNMCLCPFAPICEYVSPTAFPLVRPARVTPLSVNDPPHHKKHVVAIKLVCFVTLTALRSIFSHSFSTGVTLAGHSCL